MVQRTVASCPSITLATTNKVYVHDHDHLWTDAPYVLINGW